MISLTKMLGIGVLKNDIPKEKKRIRILNVIVYISIAHALFFLVLDTVQSTIDIQKAITLIIQLFLFTTVLYLQYKRLFKLARVLFSSLVFFTLFHHCNYAFKGVYGEYQYIVLPLISLFFFDNKYIHYIILTLSILSFYIPNFYYKNYPDIYFGYSNVFFLFIGLFLLVNFFKRENDKNENLLKKEKEKVLEDKILLEKQQQDLKELHEFKSHFFTNICHEIRTPITLIKGYANRIVIPKDDIDNKQNMAIIKMQAENIQNIVNSLLDLSKLDANQLQLNTKYEHINTLITKLFTDYKKLFNDKGISLLLKVDIPDLWAPLDKHYFIKSLNNLLSNALKFTPNGGEVSILLDFDEYLHVSVVDNGLGIPEQDKDKVFQRFYQSKNHITESRGSGLGLSFAKSILETHGFELHLESIPHQRTQFTVSIPKHIIKTTIALDTQRHTDTLQKSELNTIMLVEDNPEMMNYLKLVLKDFNTIEASNGKEALELLKHQKVNAIISDYMMPVMNGVELVKTLKSKSIKTPIIVLTARNDDAGKLDMLRIGIDAYYTKPFIEEELLLKVKQSIRLHKQLQAFEKELPLDEKLELSLDQDDFYKQLISHIEENITRKNFGVEQLAELMQLSRSTLFRKTKIISGQTPNEIIKEVRFQKARQLLLDNPRIKKKALADAVGIYNATYFYNKLKNRFDFK